MDRDTAARAAEILCECRIGRRAVAALPADCRPRDAAEAYVIQEHLHDRLSAAGFGPLVGYKIGCTTKVMQDYLGIGQPCAGGLFESNMAQSDGRFRLGDFVKVGVEAEIAVRLGGDLPARGPRHGRASVGEAVEVCMAAIEIVDDRYRDYRSLGAPTLIADDFFNAAIVVGPPCSGWRALDLARERGRLTVDGRERGAGTGGDILGHPFEALAWLANEMNRRGGLLRAGDVVMLGSVVKTHWVERPGTVAVAFDALGRAEVRFSA